MEQLSPIVKNSLFAMVDMFLEYAVTGHDLDSQQDNIAEFIVDCYNLSAEDAEYQLLQIKFKEEFENSHYYVDMNEEEAATTIEKAIERLIDGGDMPLLISDVVAEHYGNEGVKEQK